MPEAHDKFDYMREYPLESEVLIMQKSEELGNPQVTPVELAYLAGLWDGEGSFGISKMKSHGRYCFYARSSIVNTDPNIIIEIVKILDNLKITGHIDQIRNRNNKHKDNFIITIGQLTKNAILLQALIPYLHGKRAMAELMFRFVNRRLYIQEICKSFPVQNQNDKDEDNSLYEQIRRLNRKGKPQRLNVEQNIYSDDIVRPCVKA